MFVESAFRHSCPVTVEPGSQPTCNTSRCPFSVRNPRATPQIWIGLQAWKSPTCYTSRQNRCFCTIHVLGTLLRYLHSTSVTWHACPIAHSGQSAAGECRLDPLMARLAAGRARRSRASARSSPYVDEGRPAGRSRPAPCRRTTSPAAQLLLAPSGAASLMVCDDAWPKARTRRMG